MDDLLSVDTEKHCRAPLRSQVCAHEYQGHARSSITRVPVKTLSVPVAALAKTGFALCALEYLSPPFFPSLSYEGNI